MDSDYNTALFDKAKQFSKIVTVFGPDFIRQVIASNAPKKHALYLWLRSALDEKNDTWLHYLDRCLSVAMPLLEGPEHSNKKSDIVSQLKDTDKFYEAFAEIEWMAKLADKKLDMAIAPHYPHEGPDLKVKVDGSDVYAEITSLNLSKPEQKNENIWLELSTRISKIQSRRHVSIETTGRFLPTDVSPFVSIVKKKISELERKDDRNPTSLYYFSKDDVQEWYGFDGLNYPEDVQINFQKYPLYLNERNAKATAVIYFMSQNTRNTSVGTGGAAFSGIHERIKKAVLKKRRQLKAAPADAPKIVILDLYRTYADGITVEWGLQGQDAYQWLVDKRTGETVAGGDVRLNNGAFSITKTISAVVIPRKTEDASGIRLLGDVILNPNARIRIPDELLKLIVD